ncbi:hypothetical protein RvY_05066 [Ramazzottius varieornatus]|uniref:Uncharacterized protein n=1 Tax=Ramazzottius varieornatus TaxID=947166 RepID=A0A1D1V0H7_RAMVA|nr:hypothetical protein RvY_05066 [Ramazzottius varieornatus]
MIGVLLSTMQTSRRMAALGLLLVVSMLFSKCHAQISIDDEYQDYADDGNTTNSSTTALLSITDDPATPSTLTDQTTTAGAATEETTSDGTTVDEASGSSTTAEESIFGSTTTPTSNPRPVPPGSRVNISIPTGPVVIIVNRPASLTSSTPTFTTRSTPSPSSDPSSTTLPSSTDSTTTDGTNTTITENVAGLTGSEIPIRPDGLVPSLVDSAANGTSSTNSSTKWAVFPTQTSSPVVIQTVDPINVDVTTVGTGALPLGSGVNTLGNAQAGAGWGTVQPVPVPAAGWGAKPVQPVPVAAQTGVGWGPAPVPVQTGWGASPQGALYGPLGGYGGVGGYGGEFGAGLFGALGFVNGFASVPGQILQVLPFGSLTVGGAGGFGARLGELPFNVTSPGNSSRADSRRSEGLFVVVEDLGEVPLFEENQDDVLNDREESTDGGEKESEESYEKPTKEERPEKEESAKADKPERGRGRPAGVRHRRRGKCAVCFSGRASRCANRFFRRRRSFCRHLTRRCLRACW